MASRNSKGRMIYWKISYCKQLSRCSLLANLVFTWLIPNADDLGRLEGDPEIIKGMLFPYHKITERQIADALAELSKERLLIWYKVDENRYIAFPNFQEYQKLRSDRTYNSDYPDPPSIDTTCHDNDSQCHDESCLARAPAEGEEKEKRREGEEKATPPSIYHPVLKTIKGYPLDEKLDREMIERLTDRYPTVDVEAVIKDWAISKLDDPIKARDKPRGQINTWCSNAEKWGKNPKRKPDDDYDGYV